MTETITGRRDYRTAVANFVESAIDWSIVYLEVVNPQQEAAKEESSEYRPCP